MVILNLFNNKNGSEKMHFCKNNAHTVFAKPFFDRPQNTWFVFQTTYSVSGKYLTLLKINTV